MEKHTDQPPRTHYSQYSLSPERQTHPKSTRQTKTNAGKRLQHRAWKVPWHESKAWPPRRSVQWHASQRKHSRWKKRPSALSRSMTYTRLLQKWQVSLPPASRRATHWRKKRGKVTPELDEDALSCVPKRKPAMLANGQDWKAQSGTNSRLTGAALGLWSVS